jgi:hypothetical protein
MSRLPNENPANNRVAINNHRFRMDLDESGGLVTYELGEHIEATDDNDGSDCEDADAIQEKKIKHTA